jgi:hypothetical protein
MESVQRSTKLAYRLEELETSSVAEPVPAAAPAAAVSEPPGTSENAAPEPDLSSSPLPSRRHRVLNVYASNENRQRVEQQPAPTKPALPTLRYGESIWDRQLEADAPLTPQASAERDEVKTEPPLRSVVPCSAISAKKGRGVQVFLDAETKRAPRASSIAEMHNALDKYEDVLAFRFMARVVDYYPENCSDFVELACASCDAR